MLNMDLVRFSFVVNLVSAQSECGLSIQKPSKHIASFDASFNFLQGLTGRKMLS